MRLLLYALIAVAVVYLAILLAAWRMQERIVWQPPRLAVSPASGARRIDYRSDDGQPLFAYLVGQPDDARGLIISFHGNADLAAWTVPWAAEVVRRNGWAVLLSEYRGYGGLPGSPDYLASQRDARATYRLAREQLAVDERHIVLHGHSLGSAVAAELAADHAPAVLIVESPFTSARDMARRMMLPLAAAWPLAGRVHFDTRARVAELAIPIWVAHGARDGVIPVQMGRSVHASARVPGDLLVVPGAGHNDLRDVAAESYWTWLGRALDAAAARSER